jgi:hypothetical protein
MCTHKRLPAVDDMLVGPVFGEAGEALFFIAVDAVVVVGVICTQCMPGSRQYAVSGSVYGEAGERRQTELGGRRSNSSQTQ